jgi:hypothetical protein
MSISVWVKIGPDGRPTKIICEREDDLDTFQKKIKKQLTPTFNNVSQDKIIVRDTNNASIRPSLLVSSFFSVGLGQDDEHPFLVDAPKPSTGKP